MPPKRRATKKPSKLHSTQASSGSWAPFLTTDELRQMLLAIDDDMRRRKIPIQMDEGQMRVILPGGQEVQCGFYNLAVRCGAAKPADYPELVRAHFDRVLDSLPPPSESIYGNHIPTLKDVTPFLRVHLYTDEILARSDRRPICARLSKGLWKAIALDMGNALAAPAAEDMQMVKASDDELFRLGSENVRKLPLDRQSLPVTKGIEAFSLFCKQSMAASQVMFLASHLGTPSSAGALVGFPTRQLLLCLPLPVGVGAPVLGAINRFFDLVHALYDERNQIPSSGAFTPELYWWQDGKLTWFPIQRPSEGPQLVMPPEGFLDALMPSPAA